jgi:hypothetical protein
MQRVPKRCRVSCVNAAGGACRLRNCTGSSTRSCICWAYGRIYSNHGAMTAGPHGNRGRHVGPEDRAHHRRDARERFRFGPARRTYIPKKSGKVPDMGGLLGVWGEEACEGSAVAAGVGVDRGDMVGSGDSQVGHNAGAGAGEGEGHGGGDDRVGSALDQEDGDV